MSDLLLCARCRLPLPPGAAHVNEESCVMALRDALDRASTCMTCRQPVPAVLCPAHAAQAWAKVQAAKGVGSLGPSILKWMSDLGREGTGTSNRDYPDGGGKRWPT